MSDMEEKIPKEFIRKFLKAKGWKTLHSIWCDCNISRIVSFPEHPIKILWDHVSKGHDTLKPNGKMILVTKNFIRKKKVVRLDKDTIKLAESAGFKLKERHKRKIIHPSFWVINY